MRMLEAKALGVVRPQRGQDVHLLAGQLLAGPGAARARTLLGSCVCITLWHPRLRVGGMCHYLLPQRQRTAGMPLDGRFGDEALQLMMATLMPPGVNPADFECHLYGGADTMPESSGVKFNVGERNIEQGWSLIDRHGFALVNVDVGDNLPRHVTMDFGSGQVHMRRGAPITGTAGAGKAR
jgi:chemotaxis protein CheD